MMQALGGLLFVVMLYFTVLFATHMVLASRNRYGYRTRRTNHVGGPVIAIVWLVFTVLSFATMLAAVGMVFYA